jgi:hypothetical protein
MRHDATKEGLQGFLLCVGAAQYARKTGVYRSAIETSLNLFEVSLSIYYFSKLIGRVLDSDKLDAIPC